MSSKKIGLLGGRGYVGQEIISLLNNNNNLNIVFEDKGKIISGEYTIKLFYKVLWEINNRKENANKIKDANKLIDTSASRVCGRFPLSSNCLLQSDNCLLERRRYPVSGIL